MEINRSEASAGILLVIQSAQQLLSKEMKDMRWSVVYLSRYNWLKIMAVMTMS